MIPVPLQYNFVFDRVLPMLPAPAGCSTYLNKNWGVIGIGHARQPAGSGISFPFPVCERALPSVVELQKGRAGQEIPASCFPEKGGSRPGSLMTTR